MSWMYFCSSQKTKKLIGFRMRVGRSYMVKPLVAFSPRNLAYIIKLVYKLRKLYAK